ncbi:hypothetical protein [Trichormus variabilis]|uniref:Uncharacterized protein n=1 Tax=Trichormus variabilis SAG 1403-4b TaxID=447716 RepID=A0A433UFI9_ANAVA|nr:hypothetical protein [Trichormus variabilis]MBD2629759.1 hypothetical protein [Trichormus variabilis FACHB-164]RUS92578.1 hypothetical protein DSM107003_49580 [Trichormus variabilis SAG 1403-4b]
MPSILRIKDNIGTTTFKQSTQQFKDLKKSDPTFLARAGQTYFATTVDRGSSDPKSANYYGGDHWKVTFKDKLKPQEGGDSIFTWFVFKGDVEEYRLVP